MMNATLAGRVATCWYCRKVGDGIRARSQRHRCFIISSNIISISHRSFWNAFWLNSFCMQTTSSSMLKPRLSRILMTRGRDGLQKAVFEREEGLGTRGKPPEPFAQGDKTFPKCA